MKKRELENKVLKMARELDPSDQSAEARQLREAAASVRDHRTSPRGDRR